MSVVFFFAGICSASAGDVSVVVSGIMPNGTNVYVALCSGALEPSACSYGQNKPAQASTMKFVLRDVAPARYAVAAFQDMDGSGSMERSQLGIPLEPYAFSNDAGRSRKPTFEVAAIAIGPAGRDLQLRLRGIKSTHSQ
ncbi:DUF2141 domain-containing protein [Bradyrhizobium sp.]|uniref:DUF2141 domain-containing protein n=1 Tax=Bradyrhizobium sp. TaxID=376 RepID=UPI0025C6D3E7|nr:DUF2141 domain-containing protein [Bradyrhizobium sp.]